MAMCDSCDSTIVFGGKKEGLYRFCNDKCYQKGYIQSGRASVPPQLIAQEAMKIRQSSCPICSGPGPVEVFTEHKIWSAIYLSCSSSRAFLCCRACGRKKQLMATLFCGTLGWWSLNGLILTPFQIIANLSAMLKAPNPTYPSLELEKIVRTKLATDLAGFNFGSPTPQPISLANATQPPVPAAISPPIPAMPGGAKSSAAPSSSSGPFSDIGKPLH